MSEIIQLKNKIDLSDIKNVIDTKSNDDDNDETIIRDTPPINDIPIIPQEFYLPPPIILTPEEAKEKRKKIIHIKNYVKTFPDLLSEFNSINLSEKSIPELENYIEEIKLTVCNNNNSDLYLGLFQGSCNLLESAGKYINYDLTGLSMHACKNPNIIKCVKEISLEYNNLHYIPPEKRLLLLMFSMCYGVNQMNKLKNNINNHIEKDINEDLNIKYQDL